MNKEEILKQMSENKEELLDQVNKSMENGFFNNNGFKLIDIDKDYAQMEVELTENAMNPYGTAHGGLIFGLADNTMGVASRTTGRIAVTLNAQIDYIKPGTGKKLIATATAIKVGKTVGVYNCKVTNDKDELVANINGTFYFKD